MIAHNPLYGSGQAGLPHPALALGEDARAAQGSGMRGADGQSTFFCPGCFPEGHGAKLIRRVGAELEIELQLLSFDGERVTFRWKDGSEQELVEAQ